MRNYDDVVRQMQAFGLRPELPLQVGSVKFIRCRVDGDREKRGWYKFFELPALKADEGGLIVGTFGIHRANEHNSQKVEIPKADRKEMTPDQRVALKARMAEDHRRAKAMRRAVEDRAAMKAAGVWRKCSPTSETPCDYLMQKAIGAHGVRHTPSGALVVPIADTAGGVRALQFIFDSKRQPREIKRYGGARKITWPKGCAVSGHYHLVGQPRDLILVTEGYATQASVFEATQIPTVCAFFANNLLPVVQQLRHRYRDARILICADDDYLTDGNPGVASASAAALAVSSAAWVAPRFAHDREGKKLTDFNDLAQVDGISAVRSQIEVKLLELGWDRPLAARETTTGGAGDGSELSYFFTRDVLLDGYSLIFGTETVFDHARHKIISLSGMRAAAGKGLVASWLEDPRRRAVEPEQVGFDPSGTDPEIKCNFWAGWPTAPKKGDCRNLLALLWYLCSNEGKEVYDYIIQWMAYPIQHPGAKMQSALLIHGPEGTGKNTVFNTLRRIYGRYGCQFSQVELESQFNGVFSGKLLALGNEVVSRAEMYHLQGKLKTWITEPEWPINEKMLPTRIEQNHCNFVFFSNRIDIAKLDHDDRRFCVVWTPPKKVPEFYADVVNELRNGGGEAFHDYLLSVDLADFGPHSPPPRSPAKDDLSTLSMDSTERFWGDWSSGEMGGVPFSVCLSDDLYDFYRIWAQREGINRAAQKITLLTSIGKKPGVVKKQMGYVQGQKREKRTIVWPRCEIEPPEGRRRGVWIGEELEKFRAALEEWKNP